MFGTTRDDNLANPDNRELNTIIGKGSIIEGKVTINNSVRIDGTIKGDITSTGTVTVGNEGEVEGTINAVNVVIGGKVRGKMFVNSKIILEKSSVLVGDLKTRKLNIAEGAIFDGNCIMETQPVPSDKQSQVKSGKEAGK